MKKECLVVPINTLIESGIIPPDFKHHQIYQRLSEVAGGFDHLSKLISDLGEIKPREIVEQDPDFQQPIMYAYVTDNQGKFLVYQREQTGNYSDGRLTGKVSCGIGGHVIAADNKDLIRSVFR